MLKKGAKLKQTRRDPTQYYADLKMLDENEDNDRIELNHPRSAKRQGDKKYGNPMSRWRGEGVEDNLLNEILSMNKHI